MSNNNSLDNLNKRIEILRKCLQVLRALDQQAPGEAIELLIREIMAEINNKLAYLEDKRDNAKAGQIIVQPPTQAQITGIKNALADLHVVVQQTQTFKNAIEKLTELLNMVGSIKG